MARLGELDGPSDPSTVVKWRKGERQAPLGLLTILLSLTDEPAELLGLLAQPHDLAVVQAGALEQDRRGLADRALEIAKLGGDVADEIRSALADGSVEEGELASIHERANQAAQRLLELASLTAPRRRRAG